MDFFGAESFHMSKPTQMLSVQNNFEIVDIEEWSYPIMLVNYLKIEHGMIRVLLSSWHCSPSWQTSQKSFEAETDISVLDICKYAYTVFTYVWCWISVSSGDSGPLFLHKATQRIIFQLSDLLLQIALHFTSMLLFWTLTLHSHSQVMLLRSCYYIRWQCSQWMKHTRAVVCYEFVGCHGLTLFCKVQNNKSWDPLVLMQMSQQLVMKLGCRQAASSNWLHWRWRSLRCREQSLFYRWQASGCQQISGTVVLSAGHRYQHTVVGKIHWCQPVQAFEHSHHELKSGTLADGQPVEFV